MREFFSEYLWLVSIIPLAYFLGLLPWLYFILTSKAKADRTTWTSKALHAMLSSDENARRDLARDLHDDVAQELAAARMLCERAAGAKDLETATERASAAAVLLTSCGNKVRGLSRNLRPPELENGGLPAAIRALAGITHRLQDVDIALFIDEHFPRLSAITEIHAYRIAQEAVNNALKHAPGHRISIFLKAPIDNGKTLSLEIVNEGATIKGSDREARKSSQMGGLGLTSMKERAAIIQGLLHIETTPKRTYVHLEIPRS